MPFIVPLLALGTFLMCTTESIVACPPPRVAPSGSFISPLLTQRAGIPLGLVPIVFVCFGVLDSSLGTTGRRAGPGDPHPKPASPTDSGTLGLVPLIALAATRAPRTSHHEPVTATHTTFHQRTSEHD